MTSVHPLRRSLSAISGATGWLRILDRAPASAGWVSCRQLLDDARLLYRWVDDVSTSLEDVEGEAPPLVTPATYVMQWYLQVPAYVGALLLHRFWRVPELRPEDLVIHRSAFGYVDSVAVTGRRFACLAEDPDARHPDATVLPDRVALAQALRDNVVRHADEFHAAFRPPVKIGSLQRWGMVLDALDTALWQAGTSAGDELSGVRAAALVLDGPNPPLTEGTRLRPSPDGAGWTRRRQSCCFMFALPSAQVCTSCPRWGQRDVSG